MKYYILLLILVLASVALGYKLCKIQQAKPQLVVVAQNEGVCNNCGAMTVLTIRERKGEAR